MVRGRKRRPDSEICPQCGELGYSYAVPSWNSPYKNAPRNMYPRFIHEDRSKPYCYIRTKLDKDFYSRSLKVARDYNRLKKEVTIFQYQPDGKFPNQQYKKTKASPFVIYHFYGINEAQIPNFSGICRQCFCRCIRIHDLRCSVCDNTTIVWCPSCEKHWNFEGIVKAKMIFREKILEKELKKLKRNSLKMGELKWLISNNKIQGDALDFIQKLYRLLKDNYDTKKIIITYGHEAIEEAKRNNKKFSSFIRDITYLSDQYGVLEHLQERKRSSRK